MMAHPEGKGNRLYEFRICCSTQNIYDGWCLRDVWKREDSCWRNFKEDLANSSYQSPSLGQSPYVKDYSKLLQKPAICQNIFWSQDGTSFVTVHDDYGIRQFLVPEFESEKNDLIPFTRVFKNQSIVASEAHQRYSLFNELPNYNVILVALRDMPLQLLPLESDGIDGKALQNYNVIDPANETYNVPYALSFNDDNQFLAGFKRNKVSLYDISRTQAIASTQYTRQQCGNSIQKAIVSCFDQQPRRCNNNESYRLFGTYKNELYLFDPGTACCRLIYRSHSGRGFTQVLKSSNGHYVYLIKRNSNKIDILDTRRSFEKVNELELPYKASNQKLKACITDSGGLSMGTYQGTIINWTKELIEFGGISRYRSSSEAPVAAEYEVELPFGISSINVLEQCPTDDSIYSLSYSPDKFIDNPTGHERSGIVIAQSHLK